MLIDRDEPASREDASIGMVVKTQGLGFELSTYMCAAQNG